MKTIRMAAVLTFLAALGPAVSAQSLNGMTFNGAAGLYTVPSGTIGWEWATDLGIDLGLSYDFINKNPILKAGFSLFKVVEITVAEDFQPETLWVGDSRGYNNFDTIIGIKLQLPTTKTAIALGGNLQMLNHGQKSNSELNSWMAGQIYLAATYTAELFGMPAAATLALGYTFYENSGSNIDYGMGFDLILLPSIFQRYVHWIIDFSNFSYSMDPLGISAYHRGSLNTGLRLDLAAIPLLNKFKFTIDVIGVDIFDSADRSFVAGVVFGMRLR
jgi:hypothetical protein